MKTERIDKVQRAVIAIMTAVIIALIAGIYIQDHRPDESIIGVYPFANANITWTGAGYSGRAGK